ncbi:MAG: tRNA (guanosine(46)-N7)-methyltransferase TrmB [Synergistes sp.]|nr:tRNA (guanosine(46)-N7)-methyltransferase TrmB [Synergistes sp.]
MFWGNIEKVIVAPMENLPFDWKAHSGRSRIFAEIGFGNGEFMEYLARSNPDVLVVGIEVSQWCSAKAARRVMEAGLDNVRIMHGDARFLLRSTFAPESVEHVFMNFPCPWPKQRHAQRRVTVPAFTGLIEYLVEPGGAFDLATDVEWYAEEAAAAFRANSAFITDDIVINPKRPYITKYERKWKAMGKDTWQLTVHKAAVKQSDDVTKMLYREENWNMECDAVTAKSVAETVDLLKDKEGTGVGGVGHWIFRDAFVSDSGVALMLVVTSDEGFEQHFYLKFVKNPRGITVKVDSVGHPYRTPAMRAAILAALDAAK